MLKKILTVLAMLTTALAMAAVDVNKASEAELDGVKGIGPGTSKLILTERKKGDFKDWADFIARVKGVGEARATKLSAEGLTVGGTAYKTTTSVAKKDDKKDNKAAAKEDKKEAKAGKSDDKTAATAKPAAAAASGATK